MIVLDTNIVSEPLKLKPDPEVLAWLDRQAPETLYLTSISLAELSAGVEILPRRQTARGIAARGGGASAVFVSGSCVRL